MLNIIRDNVQSFGIKLIVGVIAVVMLTFGLSSYNNRNINTLVEIDGYEVKLENYQKEYERAQAEYRKAYKDNAEQYMNAVNLKRQILEQLINSVVLLKNAESNGIKVSDLELANQIYNSPNFQTDDRFDQKKYDQFLKNYRTNKIAYEKDLRETLLTQKYINFLNTGVAYSRKYVESEFKRYNTELDISILEIKPELFAKQVKVTDDQIQAFYITNKKNFEQKKQFEVSYIKLTLDDELANVKVRDKEINKYYERNVTNEFTINESFNSRHILISHSNGQNEAEDAKALKQAQWIYDQLQEDKSKFKTLAAAYSVDPGSKINGGALGWVVKGTFVKEFELAVDSLKKGEISKPFKTQFGYHVIELIDTKSAVTKKLEEVKEEITQKIKKGKAKRRLDNRIANLLKVNEGEVPKTLVQHAETTGKSITKTKAFDGSNEIEGLGYSYSLYEDINNKILGEVGSFQLSSDQSVIIYEINKVIDPFIKPIEEVKDQAKSMAQQAETKKFAFEKADEFADSVQTKEQFEKLVSDLKAETKDYKFKLLEDNREIGNMDFKLEIYKIPVGGVKILNRQESNLAVYVKAKNSDQKDVKESDYAALGNQLQRQKVNNILNGIINNTRKGLEIKQNDALLNALKIQL